MTGRRSSLPSESVAKEFFAKYEVFEVLGRGLSSVVRRCKDKISDREFAVKIIDLNVHRRESTEIVETTEDSEIRGSTLNEICVLRHLQGYPHIIFLRDVFESKTFVFLVFELCKEGELFDYLNKVATFSEKKTRFVMKQLLETLVFIHSRNVVHRDIKFVLQLLALPSDWIRVTFKALAPVQLMPLENILLVDGMNIKVTDFGFAHVLSSKEMLYELCGTPGYLAPEVIEYSMSGSGNGYNQMVDIWASGVVMYTLLVGFPPFWHHRQLIMLRNIMCGKFVFSSPEWDHISSTAKDLITKLLTVNPTERLTAAAALQHDFFKLATPVKPMDVKFKERKKFKSAALCVLAVVRMRRLTQLPKHLNMKVIYDIPYSNKVLKKVINSCAFDMYNHWVKHDETQSRALMFQNEP